MTPAATLEEAIDAFVDLGMAKGFTVADSVLAEFVPNPTFRQTGLIPHAQRAAFIAACRRKMGGEGVAAELTTAPDRGEYGVRRTTAFRSVVTRNGSAVSIPLPHADAERIATRLAWG